MGGKEEPRGEERGEWNMELARGGLSLGGETSSGTEKYNRGAFQRCPGPHRRPRGLWAGGPEGRWTLVICVYGGVSGKASWLRG